MRSVLILNPTSGQAMTSPQQSNESNTTRGHVEAILQALQAHHIHPEVWYTTEQERGDGLAQRAAEQHFDLVIASGGDGTIHAVASGLIGKESTLGIIPLGTMNNLARSLDIPETIEEACTVLATGKPRLIDVGKINGHIFLEVAGVGLDAALFPAAETIKSQGWAATLRATFTGLASLFRFRLPKLKIAVDGRRLRSYRALQVTISNTPYYGVHFLSAPMARMDDGLLDVLVFKNFSKIAYLWHAVSISQGKQSLTPRITHRRVKHVRIETCEPVEIHADGIPHGTTPAEVSILPGALRVCAPLASSSLTQRKARERTQERGEPVIDA